MSNKIPPTVNTFFFDLYGTIVDMQSGLVKTVTPFLCAKGLAGEPHRFVTWWRRTHFENSMIDSLCDRGHTSYREIGQRAVSHVLDRCQLSYTQEEVHWLVDQIVKLEPFPDVIAALERLRNKRYTLAILSNGDNDMLEAAKAYIGFHFDRIISVQEAGYFKPHWKTYASAAQIMDCQPNECLFVANHAFDCIGAKSFGMYTAFVDRRQRPFGLTPHQPDIIVSNFEQLAICVN